MELLRIDPSGSPVSQNTVQQAIKNFSTRIRNRGISSQEMLFCRDQVTGARLVVNDTVLSQQQETTHHQNHLHSALTASNARITPGDLVYIKSGDKKKALDMYLVARVDVHSNMAFLQKLLGSTFQSRQHEVPLNKVFHAIQSAREFSSPASSDSSSYSDEDIIEDEDTSSEDDAVLQQPSPPARPIRRSNRRRQSPPALDRRDWVRDSRLRTSQDIR